MNVLKKQTIRWQPPLHWIVKFDLTQPFHNEGWGCLFDLIKNSFHPSVAGYQESVFGLPYETQFASHSYHEDVECAQVIGNRERFNMLLYRDYDVGGNYMISVEVIGIEQPQCICFRKWCRHPRYCSLFISPVLYLFLAKELKTSAMQKFGMYKTAPWKSDL